MTLVLLTSVVVLGILSFLRFSATGWPRFLTPALHRNIALVTLVFLAIHIVTAVVDPFTNLGWLSAVVPFSSKYRTLWLGLGTVAAELLAAIVITSLLRDLIGHIAWRAIHWLAYAVWPIGVVHGLGTGTDGFAAWFFTLTCGCVACVGVALYFRLASRPPDPLAASRASFRAGVDRRPDQ